MQLYAIQFVRQCLDIVVELNFLLREGIEEGVSCSDEQFEHASLATHNSRVGHGVGHYRQYYFFVLHMHRVIFHA